MRIWRTSILLFCGSLVAFLAGIGNPSRLYFDETTYVVGGNAILHGVPDPSPVGPPLGKTLVAMGIAVAGDNSFGWRWPSALFGALTLVASFLMVYVLLDDHTLALTAAGLTFLNNFLFVFSRSAMMDIFLMAFAMWGVLAFIVALKYPGISKTRRRALLACSGALFGCAMGCKWNGVDELAVVLIFGALLLLPGVVSRRTGTTVPTVRSEGHIASEWAAYSANLREAGLFGFAISFLVLPVHVYSATYWAPFHSQHLSFSVQRLLSANLFIWRFHRAIVGNTGIITRWYTWPLMIEPMRAFSYLVGNWYVMWAGLVALLYSLRRFGVSLPETLLVSLYAMNMLQWILTPQSCTFYYYYFPAAMFLTLAIPVALHRFPSRYYGIRLSVISVVPALGVFAYCFAHMAHLGAPYDTMLGYWP